MNNMTLIQKLQEVIQQGFSISFSSNSFTSSLCIDACKFGHTKNHTKSSSLPLQDHFYESKVVDCIDFMIAEIKKEIKNDLE